MEKRKLCCFKLVVKDGGHLHAFSEVVFKCWLLGENHQRTFIITYITVGFLNQSPEYK